MWHNDALLKVALQGICSLLTYLFTSVHCHAANHKRLRTSRIQQLGKVRAKAPSKRNRSLDEEAAVQEQLKTQIGELGLALMSLAQTADGHVGIAVQC